MIEYGRFFGKITKNTVKYLKFFSNYVNIKYQGM